jgi:hypothetical protein
MGLKHQQQAAGNACMVSSVADILSGLWAKSSTTVISFAASHDLQSTTDATELA